MICSAQAVWQHEITRYGTLIASAKQVSKDDAMIGVFVSDGTSYWPTYTSLDTTRDAAPTTFK